MPSSRCFLMCILFRRSEAHGIVLLPVYLCEDETVLRPLCVPVYFCKKGAVFLPLSVHELACSQRGHFLSACRTLSHPAVCSLCEGFRNAFGR